MFYITKRVHFSASHRLFNPLFTEEQNMEIYGKCNNLNGHGHNYKLEVTISGNQDQQTGFLIDLKNLKKIIEDEIISKVDHKNLNLDVDFLQGVIPTIENLTKAFWDKLFNKFPQGKLYKIKLYETSSSWVEYYGKSDEIMNY